MSWTANNHEPSRGMGARCVRSTATWRRVHLHQSGYPGVKGRKKRSQIMRIGIRGKLLAGFGIVLCLMLVVGLAGWWSTASLSNDLAHAEVRLRGTVALANAESALWRLRYGFPQFIVLGPEE